MAFAGAQAVGEGIEADGGFALGGLWAGGLLCVLAIGLVLFV